MIHRTTIELDETAPGIGLPVMVSFTPERGRNRGPTLDDGDADRAHQSLMMVGVRHPI